MCGIHLPLPAWTEYVLWVKWKNCSWIHKYILKFISSVFPKWFENTINVIENLMKISLSFKLILLKTQHFKWYPTPNQHISMKVLISNGHMYVPCIKFSCSEFLTKRLNISFLILMHVWTRRFNIIAFVMLWGFGPYWNEISEDIL